MIWAIVAIVATLLAFYGVARRNEQVGALHQMVGELSETVSELRERVSESDAEIAQLKIECGAQDLTDYFCR